MIDAVKVRNVDESVKTDLVDSSVSMGGRTLEVRTRTESFVTPSRPITIPELKAKSILAFNESLEGDLGAVQVDLKGNRLVRFKNGNGMVRATRLTMTKFSNLTSCFENFATLDMPPITPDDLGTFKLILDMQSKVRMLNYISLPPIASRDIRPLESLLREWMKEADQRGKGVVPQLKMNDELDSFKKKLALLSELAKSDQIQIIDFAYADPDRFPHQFVELWKMRETNAIFNCSSVPGSGKEVSQGIHETQLIQLQKFGIDTITPLVRTPSKKYVAWLQFRQGPKTIEEIDDFRWAYHPAGSLMDNDLWYRIPSENIECRCRVCKGKDQNGIIDQYCYDERGEITNYGMYSAARLHDASSSQIEYSVIRDRIKSREMKDYVSGLNENRRKRLIGQ